MKYLFEILLMIAIVYAVAYSFIWKDAYMKKYRKKPVTIEAVQWLGYCLADVKILAEKLGYEGERGFSLDGKGRMLIRTLEGVMVAQKGDYIIKGVKGEVYPCKPDIFEMTYEEVK